MNHHQRYAANTSRSSGREAEMSKKMQKETLRGPTDSPQKCGQDGTAAKHRPSPPLAPERPLHLLPGGAALGSPPPAAPAGREGTGAESGSFPLRCYGMLRHQGKTPAMITTTHPAMRSVYSENTKTLIRAVCFLTQMPSQHRACSGAARRATPSLAFRRGAPGCSDTGERAEQRRVSGSALQTLPSVRPCSHSEC